MDEIHQRIKDFAAKQETNMTILQSSFLQKFYEIVMMKEPQDEDKINQLIKEFLRSYDELEKQDPNGPQKPIVPLKDKKPEGQKAALKFLSLAEEPYSDIHYGPNICNVEGLGRGLYFGGYKDGKRHGRGELSLFNGKHVIGRWEEGKLRGDMYVVSQEGNCFNGEIKKGRIKGHLVDLSNIDERKRMKRKLQENLGYEFRNDGSMFKGSIINSKKQDSGEVFYKNGERLRGFWNNDKKHGNFVRTFPKNSKIVQEQWRDDKLVSKHSM